ncbi:MAG TPA: hypothetical protein VK530_09605 [Candidatus Acidoferrum sp.]|nr:hypothetical protein [Candidatus Acidoferrum sp.]
MNEWNIQSRGHACQSCQNTFEDKQVYHTILFDEKRDFLRTDVCQKCWNEQYQEARDRKGFISHWHGEYQAPPAAPVEAIGKSDAESLLRKLVELNDPRHAAASFILAVMLERKRLLKVKEHLKVDGKRIFVYEHPKTGDVFTIPDPELQLNQLEAVQHDVANLLEHGLPGDAPALSPIDAITTPKTASAEAPAVVAEPAAS